MTALEQEIYDKFHKLDKAAQLRLIRQLQEETPAEFDFDNWLVRVNSLQSEIRAANGPDFQIDVVGLLREIREEDN